MIKTDIVNTNMDKTVNNSIFTDHEYNGFVLAALFLAANDKLPHVLDFDDLKKVDLSFDSMEKFCVKFREDTGLNASFHFLACESTNKLQRYLIIDYIRDEEEE